MNKFHVFISCEHAGNQIPDAYSSLFESASAALQSHEGWDPGAWKIATQLSHTLGAPLYGCHTSRLLIEVNRSLNHPQLFSRHIQHLDPTEKKRLVNEYYLPYRDQVESEISRIQKPALHISVHSFTPILSGAERQVDIGLLFDPSRKLESTFCHEYLQALKVALPSYSIQFNQPYLGIDDGFTTYLRTKFKDDSYAGIEVEVNQKFISNLEEISQNLISGLKKIVFK